MTSFAAHATRLAACVAVLLAASVKLADACSCVAGTPMCETFWRTPAVFSAVVLDIRRVPNAAGNDFLLERRVTMQVEQAWRGGVSGTIEVGTGAGGGDCGYEFQRGERYLVFADQRRGMLWVSICSGTKPLASAADDLAYLKTAFQRSATGRVFGTVTYQRTRGNEPLRPIAGRSVTLIGPAREWKTTTDASGGYEFRVPAGKYRVQLDLPSTQHAYGRRDVELHDPRGCAAAEFSVVPNGRISTRVVNADGTPAAGINVEFVKVDSITQQPGRFPDARTARSSADGRVEVSELAPDRYVIGINVTRAPEPKQPYERRYFPGVSELSSARVVDLLEGERAELDAFVLPPRLVERRISGSVRWTDGTPAGAAHVSLFTARGTRRIGMPTGTSATSGADGTFTLVALAGQRYHLHAHVNVKSPEGQTVQWSAMSPDFDAGPETAPVTLTLAPPSRR